MTSVILYIKPVDGKENDFKELYANRDEFKSYSNKGDSGYDVFCLSDQIVKSGDTACIKLGIQCEAVCGPSASSIALTGCSFMLMPRSSISKTPLRLANSIGLIDAGYRGELMAMVDNIKGMDYTIKRKERLFQLVAFDGKQMNIQFTNKLSETSRGIGGFGSTNLTTKKE